MTVFAEQCPIGQSDVDKMTIKTKALAFLQTGESELDGIGSDQIPLQLLKLETDSMTAICERHEI